MAGSRRPRERRSALAAQRVLSLRAPRPPADELDGKEIQIQLTGFLEKNTSLFMRELWALILDAKDRPGGEGLRLRPVWLLLPLVSHEIT